MLGSGKLTQAQTSVYAEASASYLDNGPYTDFLEGGTAGVLVDLARGWRNRITFSADLQGTFLFNNTEPGPSSMFYTAGEMYDAVTIGPRLSMSPHFFKLAPYVQMNLGFARYHDPVTRSTTDNVYGGQTGVTRRLTSRFDAVLDYSYTRFGYNTNYYSPQTFSLGAVYHFTKR
jgi:opacity protein-like surface antigen